MKRFLLLLLLPIFLLSCSNDDFVETQEECVNVTFDFTGDFISYNESPLITRADNITHKFLVINIYSDNGTIYKSAVYSYVYDLYINIPVGNYSVEAMYVEEYDPDCFNKYPINLTTTSGFTSNVEQKIQPYTSIVDGDESKGFPAYQYYGKNDSVSITKETSKIELELNQYSVGIDLTVVPPPTGELQVETIFGYVACHEDVAYRHETRTYSHADANYNELCVISPTSFSPAWKEHVGVFARYKVNGETVINSGKYFDIERNTKLNVYIDIDKLDIHSVFDITYEEKFSSSIDYNM